MTRFSVGTTHGIRSPECTVRKRVFNIPLYGYVARITRVLQHTSKNARLLLNYGCCCECLMGKTRAWFAWLGLRKKGYFVLQHLWFFPLHKSGLKHFKSDILMTNYKANRLFKLM